MKRIKNEPMNHFTLRPLDSLGGQRTPLQRLLAAAALDRSEVWLLVVYAIAVGVLSLAAPVAVQSLVGSVAFGSLLQPIVVLALLLLLALLLQSALKAMSASVIELIEERWLVRTALDFANRLALVKAPTDSPADSKFFEFVTIQKTVRTLLTDGLATVLQIVFGLLVLAFYHPALLAFDLVFVFLISLLIFLPSKRGLETSIYESKTKYALADFIRGQPKSTESGVGHELIHRYIKARRAHFRWLFSQYIGALLLQGVAVTSVLAIGGWLVLKQELTLGQLVAAELIVASVAEGVSKISKLFDAGYDLATSIEKLAHIVEMELLIEASPEQIKGAS
jgi:putative ABC transport system ATP-binding protein